MLKFCIFLISTILKGVGFILTEIARRITDIIIPPAPYIQGLGGADYSARKAYAKKGVNQLMAKVTVGSYSKVVTSAKTPKVDERDPLVLRTPQELMPDQGQLEGRGTPQVSSRVLTIPLEADGGLPIGTAWVYLFERDASGKALNKARRVLKFNNRALARIICGPDEMRYFFKDVDYIPENGTREICESFVGEIRKLLDRKQALPRSEKLNDAARKSKSLEAAAMPKPAPVVVQAPAPAPTPAPTPAPVVQKALEPLRPVNRTVKGQVYEGMVVSAGMSTKNGQNGSYSTFCLTLNDGEKEVPLNGTEIHRQVKDMGIQIGERVKVVSMGRSPIDVPGQEKQGWKNLYQITRLGGH
jgi:hypothetical protein